ncbi:hypothetical protein [Candidatus Viridilinea mediisalina]|uniref:Uncharacterized protein n=1 Tax=Candidatus Viridilinea mediisalina TaxID=2024553 RepID=A0A2A6RE55_9CHLR|nr:hypothetical protein [Candidatus Viridilinea mediisalina]PDW01323.1 hypothetical protein CJ255_19390 [Candidatus Viridilinea mediisalina]
METPYTDPTTRLRLLESWLPLVQAENERYGWQLAGPELEALILLAAPQLTTSTNLLTARVIIWHYQQQLQHNAQ